MFESCCICQDSPARHLNDTLKVHFFVSSAMLALVWIPRPNNKKETLKSSLIAKNFTSEILAEVLFQLYIHLILTLRNQSAPFQPRRLLLQATLKSKRWCTESYCETRSWRHRQRSGCCCVAVLYEPGGTKEPHRRISSWWQSSFFSPSQLWHIVTVSHAFL